MSIEERGSLILYRNLAGSLMVKLRDDYRTCETLSTARQWFTIGNVKLNGSQVGTVRTWFDRAAKGEFDQ